MLESHPDLANFLDNMFVLKTLSLSEYNLSISMNLFEPL